MTLIVQGTSFGSMLKCQGPGFDPPREHTFCTGIIIIRCIFASLFDQFLLISRILAFLTSCFAALVAAAERFVRACAGMLPVYPTAARESSLGKRGKSIYTSRLVCSFLSRIAACCASGDCEEYITVVSCPVVQLRVLAALGSASAYPAYRPKCMSGIGRVHCMG